MRVTLDLNPDEALALIQVLERDRTFPDVTEPVIKTLDYARRMWANDVRNMGYLRAGIPINPADADAWNRWAEKHRVDLHIDVEDEPESNVYLLDGSDNLIDITPHVFKGD